MITFEGLVGLIVITISALLVLNLSFSITGSRIKPYSPPWVFFALIVIGSVFRAFTFVSDPPKMYLYGVSVLAVSVIFYLLGYKILAKKHFSVSLIKKIFLLPNLKIFVYVAVIVSLYLSFEFFQKINVVGKRVLQTENEVATSYAYLSIGMDIMYAAFLVHLSHVKCFRKVNLQHWLMFILAVVASLMLGARLSMLLYIFGAFLVRRLVGNHKIPLAKLIVLSILIIGVVGIIRLDAQNIDNKLNAFEVFAEHMMERPYMLSIDKLALITGKMAENEEYWYGASYLPLLAAPIPRIIWQNKPKAEIRYFIAQEIYNKIELSGIPPTMLGELFINFSWFGVSIGMFMFGLISRLMWNTLQVSNADPSVAVAYTVYFIASILAIGVDLQAAVVFSMKIIIPVIFFSRVYSRKYRK